MHRKEWCLNDYVFIEKLYTGYASVGKQAQPGSGGSVTGGKWGLLGVSNLIGALQCHIVP